MVRGHSGADGDAERRRKRKREVQLWWSVSFEDERGARVNCEVR